MEFICLVTLKSSKYLLYLSFNLYNLSSFKFNSHHFCNCYFKFTQILSNFDYYDGHLNYFIQIISIIFCLFEAITY